MHLHVDAIRPVAPHCYELVLHSPFLGSLKDLVRKLDATAVSIVAAQVAERYTYEAMYVQLYAHIHNVYTLCYIVL